MCAHLAAKLVDLSVLMASDDELSQRAPHSTGNLVVTARYRQVGLVVLCRDRETFTHESNIPADPIYSPLVYQSISSLIYTV